MCCTVDVASASICIAINWADEGAYEAITNSGVKVQSLSGKDLCECEQMFGAMLCRSAARS